jgi:general secretion pathway protein G
MTRTGLADPTRPRRTPGPAGGFTLIELMVVIAILGILAALVAPNILGRKDEAMRVAAMTDIRNIEQALKMFYIDNGFYPSTEQGLQALLEQPAIGRIPTKWKGPYLEKEPKDPWGNRYAYFSPGLQRKEFDIVSFGADGQEGGEGRDADIQSWALDQK